MGDDPIMSGELYGLILRCEGLLRVCSMLEERGASETELAEHRLDVKPGITGWAQVNGRAELPWADRIELDVWYVEHRSPSLDLRILGRTPRALFGGTYKGETGGWTSDS